MNHPIHDQRADVRRFILDNYLPDTPPSDLSDDDDLLETGVIDSLGLLTLISWVEDHFDLTVDDRDLSPEKFSSVDAITEYVALSATPPTRA